MTTCTNLAEKKIEIPEGVKFKEIFNCKNSGRVFQGYRDILYYPNLGKLVTRNENSNSVNVWNFSECLKSEDAEEIVLHEKERGSRCIMEWRKESFLCGGKDGKVVHFDLCDMQIQDTFDISETLNEGGDPRSSIAHEMLKFLKLSDDTFLFCSQTKTNASIRLGEYDFRIASLSRKRFLKKLSMKNVDHDTKLVKSKSLPNHLIYNFNTTHKASALHNLETDEQIYEFVNPKDMVIYSIDSCMCQGEEYVLVGGISDVTYIHSVKNGSMVKTVETIFASWCSDVISERYYAYGTSKGFLEIRDCSEDDFKKVFVREMFPGIQGTHNLKLYKGKRRNEIIVCLVSTNTVSMIQVQSDRIFLPDIVSEQEKNDDDERTEYVRYEHDSFSGGVAKNIIFEMNIGQSMNISVLKIFLEL